MEKLWFAKLIHIGKPAIFPLTVGFVAACATFTLTYTLGAKWTSNLIILILMAPGLMASFSVVPDSAFFGPFVSSFYFGSMIAFLMSKQRYVRVIGILLIFLSIYFSCYLLMLLGLSD